MGSVLAMTSHYREGQPGAPRRLGARYAAGHAGAATAARRAAARDGRLKSKGLTMRDKLVRHRADASCATCHNLMDPIGFGLENFDWMGRWRDQRDQRRAGGCAGTMPSGEKFNGPVELRKVLLYRKDEFLRHLTGKVLGYALGRGLQDGDQCTVQTLGGLTGKGPIPGADPDPQCGAQHSVPQYAAGGTAAAPPLRLPSASLSIRSAINSAPADPLGGE